MRSLLLILCLIMMSTHATIAAERVVDKYAAYYQAPKLLEGMINGSVDGKVVIKGTSGWNWTQGPTAGKAPLGLEESKERKSTLVPYTIVIDKVTYDQYLQRGGKEEDFHNVVKSFVDKYEVNGTYWKLSITVGKAGDKWNFEQRNFMYESLNNLIVEKLQQQPPANNIEKLCYDRYVEYWAKVTEEQKKHMVMTEH